MARARAVSPLIEADNYPRLGADFASLAPVSSLKARAGMWRRISKLVHAAFVNQVFFKGFSTGNRVRKGHRVAWGSGEGRDQTKKSRQGRTRAAEEDSDWQVSALNRVAALPILALGGRNGQAHLFPQGSADEPADAVRLPASGFQQLLRGGSAGPLEQVQDLGGLAALAGYFRFFAAFEAAGALLGRGGLFFPDLPLAGATRGFRGATLAFLVAFGSRAVAVAGVVACSSIFVVMV
jgi:hypothetical protein